jgi:hypothetical protein
MSFGGSIMAGAGDDYNINVNVNLAPAQAQVAQFGQMISGMTAQASQSAAAMGAAFQTSMNTVVSQGAAAGQTMTNLNTRLQTATTQTKSFGDQLGGVIARFGGITMLAQFVRQLGQSFQDAGKSMDHLGDKSLQFKQGLQDIQAMSGKPGEVAPQVIASQMAMIRGGMTIPQAHEFAETFGGEAAVMQERQLIKPEQYLQIQQNLQEYAMAMGGDTTAVARLGGKLALRRGAGATPEGIQQQTAELFRLVGFGPGKSTAGLAGFARFMSENVLEGGLGNIQDPRAAAAMYAAISQGTAPARAPTAAATLMRGVMGQGRMGKQFEQWQMSELGVTEGMDAFERLNKIVPELRKRVGMTSREIGAAAREMEAGGAESLGGAGGKRIGTVLRDLGVKDTQVIRALTAYMAYADTATGLYAEKPISTPQIRAGIAEYRQSPAYRDLAARGAETAAELGKGQEYEERNIFLRRARASLIEKGKLTPETMPERAMYDMMTMSGWTGAPTAEQRMLATEATRLAQVEYGEDFRLGAGGRLSQREIQQQFMAGGGAPEAFSRAAARRRRRGGVRAMGAIPQPIEELDMTPTGVFESTMGLKPSESLAESVGGGLRMLAHDIGAPQWVQDLLALNRRTANATETNARDTLPPPRAPEVPK